MFNRGEKLRQRSVKLLRNSWRQAECQRCTVEVPGFGIPKVPEPAQARDPTPYAKAASPRPVITILSVNTTKITGCWYWLKCEGCWFLHVISVVLPSFPEDASQYTYCRRHYRRALPHSGNVLEHIGSWVPLAISALTVFTSEPCTVNKIRKTPHFSKW